jgi:lipoate-protein ligase A
VYLAPGEQVWIDVVIPRGDALWCDDVAQASWWLGETWLSALGSLGVTDLDVHRDSVHSDAWGDLLCFAGVGPGEVISTLGDKRAKVVGISQRRTRDYARFQCTIYMKWNPHHFAHYFAALPGAVDEVVPRVVTIDADASTIVETFVAHLPR